MGLNKIAIFVEGQGELVFFRNIIFHLLSDIPFSFDCFKLHSGRTQDVPYCMENPNAIFHFMIVNVENDAKVLSVIKEREEKLLKIGYMKIIGLRDMYSEAYRKLSNGVICEDVNNQFINEAKSIIQSMSNPEKVSFHFSIMELEAWWLTMHTIFVKINNSLTIEFINENLGYKLDDIDPEKYFFHPYRAIKDILQLVNLEYKKKLHDVESIISKIAIEDIEMALLSSRSNSFKTFINEIKSIAL